MADILRQISDSVSKTGIGVLDTVNNAAKKILGQDLATQLFDNYVPLEKYTEYQRTYNWEVAFPFSMGGIPGMIISKYCKAILLGDYALREIIEIQIGPKSQFAPGTLSINNVTAVFLVPAPNLIHGYFKAWKNLVVDEKGRYSVQDNYKHSIYVRLYTTQGITAGTIRMKGVFPRTFPEYGLSYEVENIVRYVITFSVDDLEYTGFDIGSTIPRVLKRFF
jgi:hypothetical protein